MAGTLYTNGNLTTRTVQQFDSFDAIRVSPTDPTGTVFLEVSDSGALDLSDALEGQRGVNIRGSIFGNVITSGALADTLAGGAGQVTLNGGAGDDRIEDGHSFNRNNDTLNGGAGDDFIISNGGRDTIDGGTGNDRIVIFNPGYIFGEARTATIEGGTGRDVLHALADLTGLSISGVEVLETNSMNTIGRLDQFEGFDRIVSFDNPGERGRVSLTFTTGGSIDLSEELEGQRSVELHLADVGTSVVTGSQSDLIYGGAADDTVEGGDGDDTIYGGGGNDTAVFNKAFASYSIAAISGGFRVTGEGTDRLYGVETGVFADGRYDFATGVFTAVAPQVLRTNGQYVTGTVAQFESFDHIVVSDASPGAAVILRLSTAGELDISDELQGQRSATVLTSSFGNTVIAGDLADRLSGSIGADKLYGGGGNDRLEGGAGDDALYGQTGDDRLLGFAGADTLMGGLGNDNADGGEGDDIIDGGEGDDTLNGSAGRDEIYGSWGNDFLAGGEGNDLLDGGAGNDNVHGGNGDDVITGGAGDDLLSGGAGDDTISGGTGDDHLVGGTGRNILRGDAGNDVLTGGSEVDLLYGGDGDDVLFGNSGRDVLYGGAGIDTFQFRTVADSLVGAGLRDRIADFQVGVDKIDLSAIDSDGIAANGNQAFAFIAGAPFSAAGQIRVVEDGGRTVIQGNVDADLTTVEFEIELDQAFGGLSARDFIL